MKPFFLGVTAALLTIGILYTVPFIKGTCLTHTCMACWGPFCVVSTKIF